MLLVEMLVVVDVLVVNFVKTDITMEGFYNNENLGIACNPKLGNCQRGSCFQGSSEFSIKEQKN